MIPPGLPRVQNHPEIYLVDSEECKVNAKSEVHRNQKIPFPCKYNQVHLFRVN
jgi:hypothetical protein